MRHGTATHLRIEGTARERLVVRLSKRLLECAPEERDAAREALADAIEGKATLRVVE